MAITDLLLRSMLSSEHQNQLCALAENVLGPRKDCTPGSAIRNEDDTFTGGTRYECDLRAKHVKEGSRCYSNAYMHQIAPNIVLPTLCIKIGNASELPLSRRSAVCGQIGE